MENCSLLGDSEAAVASMDVFGMTDRCSAASADAVRSIGGSCCCIFSKASVAGEHMVILVAFAVPCVVMILESLFLSFCKLLVDVHSARLSVVPGSDSSKQYEILMVRVFTCSCSKNVS